MLSKEEEKEIKDNIGVFIDIDTLSKSAGGKELVKRLNEDIITSLVIMLEKRNTFTLQDYTATACDIKSKLDIIKVISKAESNKEMLEAILEKETE